MSDTPTQQLPDNSANPGSELTPHGADAPGLPPHRPRQTDIDPRAAKRVERQVALMFLGSAVMTVLFVVAYLLIPTSQSVNIPFSSARISASNAALGITFGLAIFLIGAGAIHWAKKLMSDREYVQMRHTLESSKEEREEASEDFWAGADASGFPQRKIIRRSLLLAMGLFPIPMVILLRDLDPKPFDFGILKETLWRKGSHIVVDPTGKKLKPEDLAVGAVISAIPEELHLKEGQTGGPDHLNELAKAALILVRMEPSEIQSAESAAMGYQGILAFSKICTHVGCPISLYQQRTHHLLCPCHQSTFDLSDSANVVFGPAARALPQLPIEVDEAGFLVAKEGFSQPVGPSYWERDR